MLLLYIFLSVMMLLVVWYDSAQYRIPNWLVLLVLAAYPAALYLNNFALDWQGGLIAFGIALAIGLLLFAFRIMGAGDVKLFAALALFAGRETGIPFLYYTAILGGALAVLLLIARPLLAKIDRQSLPQCLRKNMPIPYGIAIAAAFELLLWAGRLPGLPLKTFDFAF